MISERCIVLIDGGNFYFKLKSLGIHQQLSFDFRQFTQYLASGKEILSSTYYVGKVRADGTAHTQTLFNSQQKLLAHLIKQGYRYNLGYLMRDREGVMHEKGVDVRMALDIQRAAFEQSCERIILVSSDTDLLPAIEEAQSKGIIVEYVGFSHQRSIGLLGICKDARLLKKEDLLPYISPLVKVP